MDQIKGVRRGGSIESRDLAHEVAGGGLADEVLGERSKEIAGEVMAGSGLPLPLLLRGGLCDEKRRGV